MKLIPIVSADPNISITISLEDGGSIFMTLNFRSQQRCWFYSLVGSSGFVVNNRRLVNSPNMLRQFRNVINFGLACSVSDGQEGWFQNDFQSGRVQLYEMSLSDVAALEAKLNG